MRLAQAGLYAATIGIALQLVRRAEASGSWLLRNLFLLLPNAQLAYFAAVIFPKLLTAFLLAVYAAVALCWPLGTWRRTVALALLAGLVFQVGPVVVLFPVVQLVLDCWQGWQARPRLVVAWPQAVALVTLFEATMLP